ncbi:MAG TPA: HU family DNA-binding protein [Longimicrobiales bacterium]
MNKAELVDQLAARSDLSKKDARMVVDSLFDPQEGILARAMRRGDRVSITGFGTFEVRQRAERMARNPRTGQQMRVPASKAPAFRAGKSLKEGIGG